MDRTIRVTGKGSIAVKPDTVRIDLSLTGVHKEYADAVKASSEKTDSLREAVKNAGLDPKDLKTVHFSVDTEYEGYSDKNGVWKNRFKGYRYRHNAYVKFPADKEYLGKLIAELARAKTGAEFSIGHTVKDPEAVKNALLAKAVEDSKAKAEVLAKAAGVKLREIVTVDYSWGEMEIYSRPMNKMAVCEDAAEVPAFGLSIEADDIKVEDTVTVVWRIE